MAREKVEDHDHQWIPFLRDAEAHYSKRGDGSDSFICRGQALRCANQPCELYLIVPHNPGLNAVEAVAA